MKTMMTMKAVAEPFCVPSVAWSRSHAAGVSLVGAAAYPLAAPASRHGQKRFTMAGTDIDGWPLGPRDGTSG